MEEVKYIEPKRITKFFSLVFTAMIFGLNGYLKNYEIITSVNYLIIGLVMGIVLIFAISKGKFKNNQFLYLIIYILFLCIALLTQFFNAYCLPFIALFICLYVFADERIAFISFVIICLLTGYNCDGSVILFAYIPSAVALIMLLDINRLNSYLLPVISVSLFSTLGYCIYVIPNVEQITPDLYIYPALSLVLNIVISVIVLFSYKRYVLYKYEDIYIAINDPEYDLLIRLKQKSDDEYKIAIHTAYLCDRVSSNLMLNRMIAKCLGYYHRIGVLEEGKISDNTIKLASDNNFPPRLLDELSRYEKSGWKYPVSKEATVLNYCSEVIKSILLYNNNYKEHKMDYDALIDKIFENKHHNNTCRGSELSLKELDKMKQYLKDEKLYYDFLR